MTENAKGKISPLAAWALSFGCAVGWGSFVMPGTIFLPKAGPLGTVLGVVVGGLIMAVIAWNYHVMMNRHPGPGGAYAYASAAFGIDHAFLCAWFLVLAYVAIVWANATALAIVARYTLGDIFSFGFRYTFAGFEVCLGDILLSGVAIIIAAAICVRRRLACAVNAVFAVGFGLGIVVCFAAAAAKHSGGIAAAGPAFAPGGPHPVAQVLKIVSLSPWLFVGFEGISHSSGEFSFPRKRSFAIMAASLVASVLAYSFLALLPALMHSGSGEAWPEYLARLFGEGGGVAIPTFDTVKNAIGRVGVAVMGVTMFGAIFTGLVGNTFAASRLLAAMADDGIFPPRYDRRNGDGSPSYAVFAIAAVSVLIPFLGRNGGTGLGLAICRHLAKAMGGKLEIVSEEGKGSTFSLTINGVKAADGEAGAGIRDSGFGIPDSSRKPGSSKPVERRILIVDGQRMNLMVLKSMLKKQGQSNVTMAADGSEALEILRASGAEPFDLVFTDLWMPNLDGEGLVKAIRGDAALASLRVVVVTADVEVKSRFAEMGFDDILLKPITFAMLDAVLKGNL